MLGRISRRLRTESGEPVKIVQPIVRESGLHLLWVLRVSGVRLTAHGRHS